MKFLFLILFFPAAGCSLLVPKPSGPPKSEAYQVKAPIDWESIRPEKSDIAFINPQTKSIILVNSLCKKYDSSSLESLSRFALSAVENFVVESTEKVKFNKRKAYDVEGQGEVDGVPVFVSVRTFRKNRCLYDFVLITPFQRNLNDVMLFQNFLKQLTFTKRSY